MQLGKAASGRVRKKKRWMSVHFLNPGQTMWGCSSSKIKVYLAALPSCALLPSKSEPVSDLRDVTYTLSQFFQATELSFPLLFALHCKLHQPGRATPHQHYDNLVMQPLAQSWLPSHLPWALAREFTSAQGLLGRFIHSDLAWRLKVINLLHCAG